MSNQKNTWALLIQSSTFGLPQNPPWSDPHSTVQQWCARQPGEGRKWLETSTTTNPLDISTTYHFNCLCVSCITISFHFFSNPPAVFSHPGAGPLQIPPMCTFFSLFWDRKPRRLSTKLDCNATWEALGACANTSVCQKHHMAQFYHGISTKKWKILKVPMRRYLRSLMRLVFKRTLAIFIFCCGGFFPTARHKKCAHPESLER